MMPKSYRGFHLLLSIGAGVLWLGCGGSILTGSSEGGGSGGMDGGGSGGACPTSAFFEANITFFGAPVADNCTLLTLGGQPSALLITEGVLSNSGPQSFSIDGCPQKNCESPIIHDIKLNTQGVPLHIPDGTYVQLRYETVDTGHQCAYSMALFNVPAIDGMPPNPTELGTGLWLYGSVYGTGEGAPVKHRLNGDIFCGSVQSNNWPYGNAMTLEAGDDPAKILMLDMGEMQAWNVNSALLPGVYDAKNLASLTTSIETADMSFVVSRRAAMP